MKQVSSLSVNPKNPRKISDDQLKRLKKSLEKFGDLSGIIFNVRTKKLVGGHQRIKVLPKNSEIVIEQKYDEPTEKGTTAIGFISVDGERFKYREVDWDEMTEKAANIAANKHGGDFDEDQLSEWLNELNLADYDMDLVGFEKKYKEQELEEKKKYEGEKKFFLEVELTDESEMIEVYEELLSRGLVVRYK